MQEDEANLQFAGCRIGGVFFLLGVAAVRRAGGEYAYNEQDTEKNCKYFFAIFILDSSEKNIYYQSARSNNRFNPETDLPGGVVHGLHDGQGLHPNALGTQLIAAVLVALLDHGAAAHQGGAALVHQVDEPPQALPTARKSSTISTRSSGVKNRLDTITS